MASSWARFFFLQDPDSSQVRMNLEYAGGGAACTQPTYCFGVVAQAVHQKETEDKGKGETKETKERRGTEEVGGLEICGSAESVKNHSVVGSGNY